MSTFYDDEARKLHDRTVYDLLKQSRGDMHYILLSSLLETLDGEDLEQIVRCTDWELVRQSRDKLLKGRAWRARQAKKAPRLNAPIDQMLDDYVNRRRGKLVEAKRQLRKRFDGLDHAWQTKVMVAFMEHGNEAERDFVCDKLMGEDFWTDAFIPLVQDWWERFKDWKMARVVINYCPREYLLEHLEELQEHGGYATLCLRTGLNPDPARLTPWSYLYVLKTSGGQLHLREGEETVLRWVRQYLYEETGEHPVDSIYDIPYVRRMMAYLGEMGMVEELLALDRFDRSLSGTPSEAWGTTAIRAIESEFDFPPFVYKVIK